MNSDTVVVVVVGQCLEIENFSMPITTKLIVPSEA